MVAVALPEGEFLAGWVAVNIMGFYKDVSSIWSKIQQDDSAINSLSQFGIGEGFPPGVEYKCTEDRSGRIELLSVSAPTYVGKTIIWVHNQIRVQEEINLALDHREEERIFHAFEYQNPMFAILCGKILRRLFRIYGIIYCSAYKILERLNLAPCLNILFERFMFFCMEFNLLDDREIFPLINLVEPIKRRYSAAKRLKYNEYHTEKLQDELPDGTAISSQEYIGTQNLVNLGVSSHGSIT